MGSVDTAREHFESFLVGVPGSTKVAIFVRPVLEGSFDREVQRAVPPGPLGHRRLGTAAPTVFLFFHTVVALQVRDSWIIPGFLTAASDVARIGTVERK